MNEYQACQTRNPNAPQRPRRPSGGPSGCTSALLNSIPWGRRERLRAASQTALCSARAVSNPPSTHFSACDPPAPPGPPGQQAMAEVSRGLLCSRLRRNVAGSLAAHPRANIAGLVLVARWCPPPTTPFPPLVDQAARRWLADGVWCVAASAAGSPANSSACPYLLPRAVKADCLHLPDR
jgi:hypothetical protein